MEALFNLLINPGLSYHGALLHLGGLNLSVTYTEMVHLLSHCYLLSRREVHDL